MVRNLDVTTYRNGDVIPQVTSSAWATLTTGAWCWYNNEADSGAIYGKLYNWYAVNDPRGLAPQGWHIPTDAEWTTLGDFLGGNSVAGGKMKTTGTTRWISPNTATNVSGFSGLGGGQRVSFGSFSEVRDYGYWWSAKEASSMAAWYRRLNHYYVDLYSNSTSKNIGNSVRCIRDLKIGDSYAGGILAYILKSGDPGYDANVQHGLIATTSNQSTGIQWYNGVNTNTEAAGTAIGTGLSNTNKIIVSQLNTGSYPAKLCADYSLNVNGVVYDDWYLPSRDELDQLYLNRAAIGGFDPNGNYWSSTDNIDDPTRAWAQDFRYGNANLPNKSYTNYVRAIRAF